MRELKRAESGAEPLEGEARSFGDTATFLFSAGIAILLFATLSGTIRMWNVSGVEVVPALRYSAPLAAFLLLVGAILGGFSPRILHLDPRPFVFILLFSFFTDWLCRDFSLLQGPSVRGAILLCAFGSYALLSQRSTCFFWIAALIVPLVYIGSFFFTADGRLLYSDDHPSMLHRLQMLKENFPFIPFYNPTWNAGFDNRDFFATGVLNVFLPFSPLIYLLDLTAHYNLIIALLLFVFVPLVAYLAAVVEEMEPPVPAITSLLALTSSLLWYQWGLKYGAIGFITSASLIPLNLALAGKILSPSRQLARWEALLVVVSFTMMSFWSLTAVIFLPVILAGMVRIRSVLRKRYLKPVLAALILINGPWMMLFYSASSVGQFFSLSKSTSSNREEGLKAPAASSAAAAREGEHGPAHRVIKGNTKKVSFKNILKNARETGVKVNPLILFLALPGISFIRRRWTRTLFVLLSVWLVALGIFGPAFKPQLELDRMFVVLVVLFAAPAAGVIAWTVRQQKFLSAAGLCGFLFAGVFSVSGVVHNRSLEQYTFMDDLVLDLAAAIKQFGGSGRVVFAGFMLHDLGGGHIAPLTLFAEKPLVASAPFHSVWWYTDVMPLEFLRQKEKGYEEFLDLQNASAVVVRERKWRAYFDSHPERYRPVFRKKGFSLYTRNAPGGYFLEGNGAVLSQTSNRIVVRVDTREAVIKFNYFPFVTSSACRLVPKQLAGGLRFIGLENCAPGDILTIESVNPLERLRMARL